MGGAGRIPAHLNRLQIQTSVDADNLPRDVSPFRAEEAHKSRYLLRRAEAMHGNALVDLLANLGRYLSQHVRLGEAGRHAVDRDIFASPLQCQRLGETD